MQKEVQTLEMDKMTAVLELKAVKLQQNKIIVLLIEQKIVEVKATKVKNMTQMASLKF